MHQVMNVKLYSQTIQQVKECKYLGIMMNSTNTDKAHMEYIGKKIKNLRNSLSSNWVKTEQPHTLQPQW